jgi:hypothetical protein
MVFNLTHSQIILRYKENGSRIEPYTIVIMIKLFLLIVTYNRMAAQLQDPTGMGMHHAQHAAAHHMHAHAGHHHGYKVPRIYFKIPRVLPYKEQKEKFETDDYFKKLARESEVIFVEALIFCL